jgi:heme oxygenase
MERVIGIHGESETVTVVRSELAAAGVVTDTLDEEPLVLFHGTGQASALGAGQVSEGDDIGTAAVFDATVDGDVLTFSKDGDAFTDEQTGSTWDIFGRAVDGPLEGEQLAEIPFIDTFWLTWVPADPDTRIIEVPARPE